jgi:hypothetical protein
VRGDSLDGRHGLLNWSSVAADDGDLSSVGSLIYLDAIPLWDDYG